MNTPPDTQPDDRAARIAALQARRAAAASGTGSRRHPARGARVVALLTSVAATGGVGAALYRAEQTTTVDAATIGDALTSADAAIAAGDTAGAATATVASSAGGSGASTPATAAGTASTTTTASTTSTAAATSTASTTSTAAATTTTAATDGSTYADGTYLGAAQSTRWGDVQVKVTISGGRITDVATVQIPSDSKSTTINNRATPILEAQAIALQSADLDIVSGATYTSRTYATSLQSALDKAAAAAT